MVCYIWIFLKTEKLNTDSEKSNRVKLIIESAQKRFGLYGVDKTSMREIADDIKLSKAALYYYFPDKESIYRAVVEKEQNEFLSSFAEKILNITDPEMLLREYVTTRLSYFRKLLNLSRLRLETYSDLKPVFRETNMQFREKEKEVIVTIFRKGIDSGIFYINEPEVTALLFLDLLKGLRLTVVNDKKLLSIEQEEYDILLDKTVAFTNIFIKGLKMIYY
jgi:AcrR family transcriptional regulator